MPTTFHSNRNASEDLTLEDLQKSPRYENLERLIFHSPNKQSILNQKSTPYKITIQSPQTPAAQRNHEELSQKTNKVPTTRKKTNLLPEETKSQQETKSVLKQISIRQKKQQKDLQSMVQQLSFAKQQRKEGDYGKKEISSFSNEDLGVSLLSSGKISSLAKLLSPKVNNASYDSRKHDSRNYDSRNHDSRNHDSRKHERSTFTNNQSFSQSRERTSEFKTPLKTHHSLFPKKLNIDSPTTSSIKLIEIQLQHADNLTFQDHAELLSKRIDLSLTKLQKQRLS